MEKEGANYISGIDLCALQERERDGRKNRRFLLNMKRGKKQ